MGLAPSDKMDNDAKWWNYLCSAYNFSFGVFHLTFSRLLQWDSQLSRLSEDNAAIMRTLNSQVSLHLFFTSFAYGAFAQQKDGFSRHFRLAWACFWAYRLVNQFLHFNMTKPIHQAFAVIFAVGTFIHVKAIALK